MILTSIGRYAVLLHLAAAGELGDDLSAWRREGIRIGFIPNLIPNEFRGTERPTYQQVLEFAPEGAGS